jgi:hypothetical protein
MIITDVQGMIAKTALLDGGMDTDDVSALAGGMYMVSFVSAENFETKVLMIE